MNQKLKKLFSVQLILISTICLVLGFNNVSFAEGEDPDTNTKSGDKGFNKVEVNEDVEAEENPVLAAKGPGYKVLGRKLTEAERALYKDEDSVKAALLHKEQKLVVVRALLAVGESKNIKEIVDLVVLDKLKTFTELINDFTELKEKSGSILKGLKDQSTYKDDTQTLRDAASEAYLTVFGIAQEDQDLEKIVNYFKTNNATTFSKMVNLLVESMSPEDKKEMLFRTLDEIGRPDLKTNKAFTEKLLAQKFTYENLKTLLKEVAKTK